MAVNQEKLDFPFPFEMIQADATSFFAELRA